MAAEADNDTLRSLEGLPKLIFKFSSPNFSKYSAFSSLEAQQALQQLKKADLNEIASFARPPQGIVTLMQTVSIFLKHAVPADSFTWNDGRKLLRSNDFIEILLHIDKDQINAEQVARAAPYMAREEMQPNIMKCISRAGANLLMWVQAIYLYGKMKHQTISQ